jgi:Family of unknown function (DUF6064)
MSEWLSYSLDDLLMFSPRVYWRLFELHNRSIWPAQAIALMLGIAALALLLRPRPWSDWLIASGLGFAWVWVAWSFLWLRYATINWAIAYVAPVFALEALLLILLKGTADRLLFTIDRSVPAGIGLTLYLYAVVFHPLVPLIAGRSLWSAEVLAIAPDPTAIATLGLVAMAPRREIAVIGIIPAAWCLTSWATLHTMGSGLAVVPLAAICLTGLALAIRLTGSRPT